LDQDWSFDEDYELAEEVSKALGKVRLNNEADRQKTWVPVFKLKKYADLRQAGWFTRIRSVEQIPGGWRATLWITPQVIRQGYSYTVITDPHHVEVWKNVNDKISLESSKADGNPVEKLTIYMR
jgi:hypothetical protein